MRADGAGEKSHSSCTTCSWGQGGSVFCKGFFCPSGEHLGSRVSGHHQKQGFFYRNADQKRAVRLSGRWLLAQPSQWGWPVPRMMRGMWGQGMPHRLQDALRDHPGHLEHPAQPCSIQECLEQLCTWLCPQTWVPRNSAGNAPCWAWLLSPSPSPYGADVGLPGSTGGGRGYVGPDWGMVRAWTMVTWTSAELQDGAGLDRGYPGRGRKFPAQTRGNWSEDAGAGVGLDQECSVLSTAGDAGTVPSRAEDAGGLTGTGPGVLCPTQKCGEPDRKQRRPCGTGPMGCRGRTGRDAGGAGSAGVAAAPAPRRRGRTTPRAARPARCPAPAPPRCRRRSQRGSAQHGGDAARPAPLRRCLLPTLRPARYRERSPERYRCGRGVARGEPPASPRRGGQRRGQPSGQHRGPGTSVRWWGCGKGV